MPKRPQQHQLEDTSRAKFQLKLPKNWVFRSKEKDYGIDGEVELFDDSGASQGLIFYVQLKATDSADDLQIFNVNFKIETLKYFSHLDLPVLLVRYSGHLDEFFIKWINSPDLTFAKKNAKTFQIKLDKSLSWNQHTALEIEKDLNNIRLIRFGRISFPVSYSIIVDDDIINGVSKDLFKVQIQNELKRFELIKYDDNNSLVKVIFNNETLSIHFGILKGVHIHSLKTRGQEDFLVTVSQDILLGIAMCLILCGYTDFGARLVFENNVDVYLIQKEEIFVKFLPHLLESVFFKESLKLINKMLFNSQENEIIIFPSILNVLANTSTSNKKKNKILEKFFLKYIESANKQMLKR